MPTVPAPVSRGFRRWGRAVVAVFAKELREALRDRRTLVAAIALPALTMPVVVLALPVVVQRQQTALRDRPARVAADGAAAEILAAAGVADGVVALSRVNQPRAALARGDLDLVIEDRPETAGQARVISAVYDATRPASQAALQKVTQIAARLALSDLQEVLRARGVDLAALATVVVRPENIATPRRTGGALLATGLPLFLSVWVLLGGQYAALDVGVGERERGSLDALLVMPPARSALVAGKFLAVLAPALLALGVMLSSALVTIAGGAGLLTDTPVRLVIGARGWLVIAAAGGALAAFLSACQVAVSLASTSLREAQQAFAGLYFVVALPVMFEPLLDLQAGRLAVLVPVLNAVRTIRLALLGDIDAVAAVVAAAVMIGLTFPVLLIAVRLLETRKTLNR